MKFTIGLITGIFLANGVPKYLAWALTRNDPPPMPPDWQPKTRRWIEGVEQ